MMKPVIFLLSSLVGRAFTIYPNLFKILLRNINIYLLGASANTGNYFVVTNVVLFAHVTWCYGVKEWVPATTTASRVATRSPLVQLLLTSAMNASSSKFSGRWCQCACAGHASCNMSLLMLSLTHCSRPTDATHCCACSPRVARACTAAEDARAHAAPPAPRAPLARRRPAHTHTHTRIILHPSQPDAAARVVSL